MIRSWIVTNENGVIINADNTKSEAVRAMHFFKERKWAGSKSFKVEQMIIDV